LSCGDMERFRAQDEAYVKQLEEERGPIDVEEYARINVSVERGTAEATLEELQLPREALMPIERVWLKKRTQDSALRERVRKALEEARKKPSRE